MYSGNFAILKFGAGNFSGIIPETKMSLLGFTIRGKVGKNGGADPLSVNGIYQMRKMKIGKRPIKMRFYQPTNPRTTAQQANRQKFADAMTAWGALSSPEKQEYIERAKKSRIIGYNLFVKEYMETH